VGAVQARGSEDLAPLLAKLEIIQLTPTGVDVERIVQRGPHACLIDELASDDLDEERRHFPVRLPIDAIKSIGGSSLRIPYVRRPPDVEQLLRIYRQFPRLGDATGWNARFGREATSSALSPTTSGFRSIPFS